jgi:hypothetical protein
MGMLINRTLGLWCTGGPSVRQAGDDFQVMGIGVDVFPVSGSITNISELSRLVLIW